MQHEFWIGLIGSLVGAITIVTVSLAVVLWERSLRAKKEKAFKAEMDSLAALIYSAQQSDVVSKNDRYS